MTFTSLIITPSVSEKEIVSKVFPYFCIIITFSFIFCLDSSVWSRFGRILVFTKKKKNKKTCPQLQNHVRFLETLSIFSHLRAGCKSSISTACENFTRPVIRRTIKLMQINRPLIHYSRGVAIMGGPIDR